MIQPEKYKESLILILLLSFSVNLMAQEVEVKLDSVIAFAGTEKKNYKDACFLIHYSGNYKTILHALARGRTFGEKTLYIPNRITFKGARKYIIIDSSIPNWIYSSFDIIFSFRRKRKGITEVKIYFRNTGHKGTGLTRGMIASLGSFVQSYYQERVDHALKRDEKIIHKTEGGNE